MTLTPRQQFTQIYQKWALPLTKFIIKRLGGNQEAVDEIFSQTIHAAWKGFATFRHKSSYFTWLCRIALNKTANYYRDQINRNSKLIFPGLKKISQLRSNHISPEEKLVLKELRQSVNACLNLLPPDKRQLLHLRYWKEMTLQEIADLLNISIRAAEGRLYRARRSFSKHYLLK